MSFLPSMGGFATIICKPYQTLQPGSYPLYMYARGLINETYSFSNPSGAFLLQAQGQISNKVLLPSEQFGLGGYDTVRGYPERIVNYDNAICLNFELRAPSFSVLKRFRCEKQDDSLVLFGFFDYGYGRPHKWSTRKTGGWIPPEKP